MEMGMPLSVLIVEDSASDAGLMIRHLQKEGFDAFHKRVESADEMRIALREAEWDVVLSDFKVPGFGASPALALLHESNLDLPFILVSGAIGEEAAVGMMKAGAHDYVMKEHLGRLAPVVQREVGEARGRQFRRKAEAALRISEASYRAVTQTATDAIVISDAGGSIRGWNTAAENMFGYGEADILGRPLVLLIPQRYRDRHTEGMRRVMTGGERRVLGRAVELYGVTREGAEFPLELSLSQWETAEGIFFTGMIRDISERRRQEQALEESEKRFRGLIEQSLIGTYIMQDGVFVYANPRLEQLLGYGPGELVGVCAEDIVAAEDRLLMQAEREKMRAGVVSSSYEALFRARDGALVELGVQGRIIQLEGKPAVVGTTQDITEKKRAEKKIQRYIEQLRASFMSTVEVATALSEMHDPYTAGHERRVALIAAAIGAKLGLDEERIEGLRVAGALHDAGKITIPAGILARPGKLSAIEFQMLQGHARAGFDVLKAVQFPWPVAEVALQHHERMDGSGYPQGLKGEAVVFEARVIAVADVVEAMASHRPYRPSLGIEAALAEIECGRGTVYDADVADACLRLFRESGYALPE